MEENNCDFKLNNIFGPADEDDIKITELKIGEKPIKDSVKFGEFTYYKLNINGKTNVVNIQYFLYNKCIESRRLIQNRNIQFMYLKKHNL